MTKEQASRKQERAREKAEELSFSKELEQAFNSLAGSALSVAIASGDSFADNQGRKIGKVVNEVITSILRGNWAMAEAQSIELSQLARVMLKNKTELMAELSEIERVLYPSEVSKKQEKREREARLKKLQEQSMFNRLVKGIKILGWIECSGSSHSRKYFRREGQKYVIMIAANGDFKRGVDRSNWLDFKASGLYREVVRATEEQVRAQEAQMAEMLEELGL
jgi:hypothetical protein